MGRMERFNEWMKKDTAKDVIAPIVADYDLKTCIELKKNLTRHENKIYFICIVPCLLFLFIALAYMEISKYLSELGIIAVSKPDLNGPAILIFGMIFIMIWAGYCCFTGAFKRQLDKRIEVIAGVDYGKETESNDKQ